MTSKRSLVIAAIALPGLILGARSSFAGPWVDDRPGHGFVSIGYSQYDASEYYTGPGEQNTSFMNISPGTKKQITVPKTIAFGVASIASDYRDQAAQLYGEVSLWKRLAFVAQMPVLHHVTQDLEGGQQLSHTGAGDLTFGFKWQAPTFRKLTGLAFGPQVYVTTQTGNVSSVAHYPIVAGVESDQPLPIPTGNGTTDIEARFLSIGYSFYPIPIFAAADVGYHHHFNVASCTVTTLGPTGAPTYMPQNVKYSDDIPWSVVLGSSWAPHYKGLWKGTLIANVKGVHSLENGDVPGQNGIMPKQGGPFSYPCGQANNLSSVNFGGTLMWYPVKYFGLAYSIDHTLWGINTGYGLTNSISIVTEF